MSHKIDPSLYSKRIWAGDPETVAEARAKYASDPEQLVPFAVALYSFRRNKIFAKELLSLRPRLIAYAKDYTKVPFNSDSSKVRADKLDVLSTYFEWMIRRPELSGQERTVLYLLALSLCVDGVRLASESPLTDHTWSLLRLTQARLYIYRRKFGLARDCLDDVAESVEEISDLNQKTRVCRKLGLLYRKSHLFWFGIYWGIRACTIPGVPRAVRIKSIAALLGVDS